MEDPNHPFDGTDCRHTLVMGKLKDSLLMKLAAFNPSISINSDHASFIEHRLQELFNSFHTPTHPPYALMIQRAIMELNEETGSTEEAISEFIRREYKDLPWAHVSILDLHLRKLCLDGELVCTKNWRYMLLVDYGRIGDEEETECKGSKKGKRGKKRRNDGDRERIRTLESGDGIVRDNGLQDQEIKEQIQVSELHDAGTDNPRGMVELDEWTQEHGEAPQQSSERVEELRKSEKQLLEVVEHEQKSQSEWQGTEVIEEHTEAEIYQGQMAQAQSEAEEPQIQEAIMEFNDKIVSSKVMYKEPYQTNAQQDLIIGKHIQDEGKRQVLEDHYYSEEQQNGVHDELNELCDQQTEVIQERNTEALMENQTHIQQIQVTTEMSGFGSDEKTSDLNFSASHGGPTTAVIPEGNLAGIVSLTQLQLQMSCHGPSATELIAEPKMTDSLSSVDVHEYKQEQHLNLGSPKCKLDENPMSRDPEQLPPKNRCRGRPRKSKPVADYPGESLLPSDDHELKQPLDWSQGCPKRKLCENTACGDLDQLPLKRRCRGRPPNPKPVTDNPVESLFPSDDDILNEKKTTKFKMVQQQPQPIGRGRGRGRPPKLHRNVHQCKEQFQP